MNLRNVVYLLAAGAALLPISCGRSDSVTIQGCGATFPAPLYKRWFLEYYKAHPGVRVNYQAIGSGAGVSQLEEGLAVFAASDESLKKDKLEGIAKTLSDREHRPVELLQAPLTAGSVALCYNVPGNPALQLPRKVYVGIALGEIRFWDDDAIKAANPGVNLPHLAITFVRRAESSGTTYVFTSHLSAIDERWKNGKGLGADKSPQWPVGIGGKGNAGVAALIQQTPGAFGYLETGYAELLALPMAKLENHAGNYVEPTGENSRIALEEAKFNDVLAAAVPDPKGYTAYPIVTFTWVIYRKHYHDQRLGEHLKDVFRYCLDTDEGKGQALSESLGYVPLPKDALERSRKAIKQINAE
jgi:phosphate transport system substrate-binding protein